ncbi:GT4 family glycosyltransferase PelF [Rubrivirga sp. IMCC43871]|uniref:GT4 family glycosyltransferase PelF n=1 Tax=Rubrivirga sp. IMCC43871 TaxID=3391575 RepID=UPI00399008B3
MSVSPRRPSVLLTTEGTYPFEGGGVTAWADVVIHGLPDVDVHLLAVTGSTALRLHRELPEHVKSIVAVPLFGSAEPTEFTRHDEPFATTVLRRARTSEAVVESRFIPLVERLLDALQRPEEAGWDEARLIRDLNRYFVRYDHRASFRAEGTWEAFRDTMLAQAAGEDVAPSLGDMVQALRWLYSFLLPITVEVPKTDLAHATLAGFAGLAGVIAKVEHGTPLVVTDHGIYLRERYIAMSASTESFFLKRFLLRLVHLVSRVCYVAADQVSPVCRHNARWEERMGVTRDRIRPIYNGIDTDRFAPPTSTPAGRRPTVVTAARVFPLKDIETLIRACAVTRRRVPDVHFVVYGANWVDKPYTARCEALIDEVGVRDHFTFAGYHDEPSKLYHEGDVFALSSISEGFPFSVIEAMACGRPVVATDVGGVKEAVEGIGIVVPPRGVEPLGEGLADLLLDRERYDECARLGRERAVRDFGLDQMLDAHRLTYRHWAGLTDVPLPPALGAPDPLALPPPAPDAVPALADGATGVAGDGSTRLRRTAHRRVSARRASSTPERSMRTEHALDRGRGPPGGHPHRTPHFGAPPGASGRATSGSHLHPVGRKGTGGEDSVSLTFSSRPGIFPAPRSPLFSP